MIRILFVALLSLGLTTAQASTITATPRADDRYNLYIEGPISRGDYKKLTAIIKQRREFPYFVTIESPGGDVEEAMAMGRLFRKALVSVMPDSKLCNSSCALMVFASANFVLMDPQDDGGKIGIHRPIYDPIYFAELSFAEAQEKTRELDQTVRAYLKEMDVPNDIADKMTTVPSNDVVYLTVRDYRNRIGHQPPAVFEWLKARCGTLDPGEKQDFESAMAYREYNGFMNISGGERWAAPYRERARLGAQLSSGYRDYLFEKGKKMTSCRDQAVAQEQRRFLMTIK